MNKSVEIEDIPLRVPCQYIEPKTKPTYEDYDFCKNKGIENYLFLKKKLTNIEEEIKEREDEISKLNIIFYDRLSRIEDLPGDKPFEEINERTKILHERNEKLLKSKRLMENKINKIKKYIDVMDAEINRLTPGAPTRPLRTYPSPRKRRRIRYDQPSAKVRISRIDAISGIMTRDEPGETINFSDSD